MSDRDRHLICLQIPDYSEIPIYGDIIPGGLYLVELSWWEDIRDKIDWSSNSWYQQPRIFDDLSNDTIEFIENVMNECAFRNLQGLIR